MFVLVPGVDPAGMRETAGRVGIETSFRFVAVGSVGALGTFGLDRGLWGVDQESKLRGSVETVGEPAFGFDSFFRREYEPAVRLAWLLTGSQAAGEDAVQDAMASVYRSFATIDVPRAYLRRAVVNRARSWQRNERRQRDRVERLTSCFEGEAADRDLLDMVSGLPYRQRVVIVGRYWGGWSEQELARALDCRPGTIKSLASRALNALNTEMGV
jgi:RNA polymerase sigma factor (sigma-70 family)